ncbi:MAG: hypothetical protein Ta2B_15480 [Termitinemataceae bacterium]|nr:MAG: hypothetical protein Ta2B_15480 [Termitinemataceae bacterium]
MILDQNKFKNVICTVSVVGMLSFLAALAIPAIRIFIISLAEQYLVHRSINHPLWEGRILTFFFWSLVACVVLFFLNKSENTLTGELNKWDYIIFACLTLFCYFASNQGDIFSTVGASKQILNGHLFDFYSFGLNYMPSTYLLFAVWGLPLKILGLINGDITPSLPYGELMWYKAYTTLFYAGSALLIYKIGKCIGFDNKKSKLAAFIFLSCPIGFFSQFIFGQYDIFTVFFLLLGIYYYFKNNMLKFSLFFGAAITFKYQALLFFIVLLLLKEKSIKKIVKYCALAAILFFLEMVLFIRNEGYVNGVFGFTATAYVNLFQLSVGPFSIQVVPFLFIFICAFAYFKKTTNYRSLVSWALFLCNAVVFILFGLSVFHPQWLLIAVPFLTLSTCINKNYKTFLLLDILMMIIFCIFSVNVFPENVDESMFGHGFFKFLGFFDKEILIHIKDIYVYKDISILYTILSGILFINVIFKAPRFCLQEIESSITDCTLELRARFIAGTSFFIIPALICVFAALNSSP